MPFGATVWQAGPCLSWATQWHLLWKAPHRKARAQPAFHFFLCSAPFLAPDIVVWKRHTCFSTLLQNTLFRGFSASSRKHWKKTRSCGEWTNLFKLSAGDLTTRALLHLERWSSTFPGSYLHLLKLNCKLCSPAPYFKVGRLGIVQNAGVQSPALEGLTTYWRSLQEKTGYNIACGWYTSWYNSGVGQKDRQRSAWFFLM